MLCFISYRLNDLRVVSYISKLIAGVWSKLDEYINHDSSVNSISWAPHELGLMLVAGSSDGTISTLTYTGGGGAGGQQWETDKISSAHMIGCNAVSWYDFISSSLFNFARTVLSSNFICTRVSISELVRISYDVSYSTSASPLAVIVCYILFKLTISGFKGRLIVELSSNSSFVLSLALIDKSTF